VTSPTHPVGRQLLNHTTHLTSAAVVNSRCLKPSSLTGVSKVSCISSIPRVALIAQCHEHDIHNARCSKSVFIVANFNS
jgi:hypothetical protein